MKFWKMHGAGNDFVVVLSLEGPSGLDADDIRFLADRRLGVGCDQVLVAEPPRAGGDCVYRIFNPDGGEVEHCGNGSRCLGKLLLDLGLTEQAETARLEAKKGMVKVQKTAFGYRAAVGKPDFRPEALPFVPEGDPIGNRAGVQVHRLGLVSESVDFIPVSVGNPHAVLFCDSVRDVPLTTVGPRIETHAAFPRGVNVEFVEIVDRSHVRFRVWERGAGETLACGTGAAAAAAAGIQLGLLDRRVNVETPGGLLRVEWPTDDVSLLLTGPAELVFEGNIDMTA